MPNLDLERKILWDEVTGILGLSEISGCIWGGDFDVTRFPSERSGESHNNPTMRDFF